MIKATYRVRERALGGDGSVQKPFGSPQEAMQSAVANRVCEVEMDIEPGSYSGDLAIPIPTTLLRVGDGTVAFAGSIRNLSGRGLNILDLQIRGAGNVGIEQAGGSLRVERSQILSTTAAGGAPTDGTALRIRGGAIAVLNNVELTGNLGQALNVSGAGTRVWANALVVRQNHANPVALSQADATDLSNLAAVEATDGAALFVEAFALADNEFGGLRVHESAQGYFRNGTVSATKGFPSASTGSLGGDNISVSSFASVQLENFLSERADSSGLVVRQAWVSSHQGQLVSNLIGLATLSPGPTSDYVAPRCLRGVTASGNQTDVYQDAPSVPDAQCNGGPGEPPRCTSFCRQLTWQPSP